MVYRQPEIDLMYWQYCMGVLEVANQLENVTLEIVNGLSKGRFEHLSKMFKIAPTYRVQFDKQATYFSIKKLPV